MSALNRRTFLKFFGGSAATLGLGIGLSRGAWAAADPSKHAETLKVQDPKWEEWEFYFPGEYDREDAKVLKKFQADLAFIDNMNINIDDLIIGKLEGKPGISEGTKITAEIMESLATKHGANNPLWTDKNYAKKTKWGNMAMPFAAGEPSFMPAMPKAEGIGDYMVVSAHNDSINYYKPVYEGDTIYRVIVEQHCTDITPTQGSYYRTFTMSGYARLFNQKGELVAEGANILNESFRRHKDPAKRNPSRAHAWEAPDWWQRKAHIYTDKDWEEIKSIWKNEKIRGAEPLYWDDVNIGDEPPPRAVGPICVEEELDVIFDKDIPNWNINAKQNILDPKKLSKMVKNKQGIYVLPEHIEKKTSTAPVSEPGVTPRISNWDGRGHVQNAICVKFAAGMIYNWMGDEGWLQRIGWDIMELPPGSTKSISFSDNPTVIPVIPKELRPALFDKYPYLEKVPYMRGCRAAWHALDGDLIISRAYVTDKYKKDGEYFVDLVFWCETIDNYLIEEGFMTVKLPKK